MVRKNQAADGSHKLEQKERVLGDRVFQDRVVDTFGIVFTTIEFLFVCLFLLLLLLLFFICEERDHKFCNFTVR